MSLVGRTYLEHGEPVEIVAQWRTLRRASGEIAIKPEVAPVFVHYHGRGPRFAPRNVLIRRANGELVVRPFRGLRKLPTGAE